MEYTGAVGTAPFLNSRQMNGPCNATSPRSARLFLWMGTAAVIGAMVMDRELTAFRLYAAHFGNSIDVQGMTRAPMLKQSGGPACVEELAQRAAT